MPIVNDVTGVSAGSRPKQRVQRLAEILADEIVQREIEAGARRRRNAGVQQRLEMVRIVRRERFEAKYAATLSTDSP